MAQLIFRFNSEDIIHNYQQDETISSILQSFCHKVGIKRDNFAFLCNGTILNEQSSIQSLTPNLNNQIIILVTDIQTLNPSEPVMRKSNYIICPQCKESIILSVKDYKVSLYQCKNGHRIDNILLSKFYETQNEDISKILCDKCKCSKARAFENKMFICVKCKYNLCIMCAQTHDRTHNLINYDQKNYICENDGENFTSYCTTCKKSICSICEMDHNNHDILSFGKLIGNRNEIIKHHEILKNDIDKFKNIIKSITNKLNKVSENIDTYFEINKTIISSTQRPFRNSEELLSLNEINNNTIHKDIMCIINENDINSIIRQIFEMYKKMENVEEINLQNIIENENEKINDDNINNNENSKNNIIVNKEHDSVQNNNLPQENNKENQDINNNNIIINTNTNKSNNNIINNNEIKENKINNNIINNNIINNNANNNNQINNNQIENNNIINTNVNNESQSNETNENIKINNNQNENNNIINTNVNNESQSNNNNENINKINNNIININNNNTNNNNNNNSNQITDQGNNNINLDLRPNSNSELELINNLLNVEMENLIREDIDSNTPLISDNSDTIGLLNEYKDNSQYIDSVQTIANKYKSIRKIRRDGNCFYRGFIYRIFEYICINKKTELYEKMCKKIDEARDLAKKNLLVSNLIDEFYNLFIGEFCTCYNSLTNSGISSREYLDKLFDNKNKEKCNYLVLFIRYSIAEYLRENKMLYEAYVDQNYDIWLINEVEPIDKEADQIQIMACVNFFEIGVKIEYLSKAKSEIMKFPEDKDDKDIFIIFFFTPGHYDLLYDK